MRRVQELHIYYKSCKKCGRAYPLWHFRKYKRSPDGHYYYCSECEREYKHQYYNKNKDKVYKKHREWVWKNNVQMMILRGVYRMRQKLIAKGTLPVDYVKRLRRPLSVQEVKELHEKKKKNMTSERTWRDLLKDIDTGENE